MYDIPRCMWQMTALFGSRPRVTATETASHSDSDCEPRVRVLEHHHSRTRTDLHSARSISYLDSQTLICDIFTDILSPFEPHIFAYSDSIKTLIYRIFYPVCVSNYLLGYDIPPRTTAFSDLTPDFNNLAAKRVFNTLKTKSPYCKADIQTGARRWC